MTTAFEKVGSLMESAVAWPERLKHPLIFATNNRTGSAATRAILMEEVGPDDIFPYGVVDQELRKVIYSYEKFLESAKENRHLIYYGHFYYGVHQHIPRDCIYFTTVRDPVERVLSCYDAVHPDPRSQPDLKTWLKTNPDAQNGMVKRFCGFGDTYYRGDPAFASPDFYGRFEFFDYNQNQPMPTDIAITEDHLKKAFDVIDSHYGFIFLHSHFVENTVILQKILGTGPLFSPLRQKFSRLSITPRRETCSEADQTLISAHNRYDEILYSVCKERYLAFLTDQDETFQEEVRVMKIVDQIVDNPGKQFADLENVTAHLNATIAALRSANLASVAVQVLARFTGKKMLACEMSQQAIQMIQQIGTPGDVVREVEKYRTKFGNDDFISSLDTSSD